MPLLSDLVASLADGIEKLYAFLRERQVEFDALRGDLARIGARQEELGTALEGLKTRAGWLASEVEDYRRDRVSFASGLTDIEQWLRDRPRENEQSEAMLGRVSSLEQQVATLRSQLEAAAAAAQRAEGSDATNDKIQTVLQSLRKRQDELQIVLGQLIRHGADSRQAPVSTEEQGTGSNTAAVADLTKRIEILERQEMAVSRIIDLLVERSKLIGEDEATTT